MTTEQNLATAMRVFRIGAASIAAGFVVLFFAALNETLGPVRLAVNLVVAGYGLMVMSFVLFLVLEWRHSPPTKE